MHCANCAHWLWQDGVCDCNNRIAKDEFDKICPNCEKGSGKGKCISNNETNEINNLWENIFT